MPNIFDDTAEKAFNLISIRKTWSDERPTQEELEEIDQVIADMHGFALRVGGGLEESVPQYAIGYVFPKGATIRMNQQNMVEEIQQNASYFDEEPFVTLTPVNLSKDELQRAELVGTPPEEALAGLKAFRDDLDEYGL